MGQQMLYFDLKRAREREREHERETERETERERERLENNSCSKKTILQILQPFGDQQYLFLKGPFPASSSVFSYYQYSLQ